MTVNLTAAELIDATGYRQKSKQAEWLRLNKFVFRLNRQLQPRVARAHYEQRMGLKKNPDPTEPNWSALST